MTPILFNTNAENIVRVWRKNRKIQDQWNCDKQRESDNAIFAKTIVQLQTPMNLLGTS